ncbi:MAG: PDDEXK nuclease domain-containing protein [Nanoarchaeota archaeon]
MQKQTYNRLILDIGQLLEEGRRKALHSVNSIIVQTYRKMGKKIADFEGIHGKAYGSELFEKIAKGLYIKYGKGFSRSNIIYMRLLYRLYPKSQTLSDQLSWSHYVELVGIENNAERAFYEKECIQERWDVRSLRRQIESGLIHRLLIGKSQGGILQLSQKGQAIQKPEDIVKDPYVFKFLKLPEHHSEKQLEERIIGNLKMFLPELGKGFSFVARQFRINIGEKQFYADLVFYNKNLQCYVLIDLKIGKASHSDVGQMNLYLNYFKSKVNSLADNEPIGIILSRDKENIEIKYALGGMSNRIFASKYRLSLPSPEDLRKVVEKARKSCKLIEIKK